MVTQEQIDSFHRFATEQIANGGSEKSLDELYDQWRFEHASPEDVAENVAAVQASIDDMKKGERGRDAREVIQEVRKDLDLPSSE